MKKKSMMLCYSLLLFIFTIPLYAQLPKVTGISSTIELADTEIKADEPLKLKFVLRNNSDQKLNILTWFTPLEGMNANIFAITKDGQPVKYLGRLVKRGAPDPEDYLSLDAGAEVSAEVDLTEEYNIYEIGDYTIEFKSKLLDFGPDEPQARIKQRKFDPKLIQSNALSFKLTEARPKPARKSGPPDSVRTRAAVVFRNCSQTQKDILNRALEDAREYAVGTQLGLVALSVNKRSDSPRYTKWFGNYTAARYDQVTDNFDAIYKALANQTVTFHCDCDEDYYAYVFADEPYHIYICNVFWSAPDTGRDSQMGTIIHETSHFYVVAGTDDHAYGHSDCMALADSDPDLAVDNADSHEYIAENSPREPFSTSGVEHMMPALILILLLVAIFGFYYSRKVETFSRNRHID